MKEFVFPIPRFIASHLIPEGKLFGDRFSDGQDNFDFHTYAGNPRIPALMLTILKKHFGYKDDSPIVAHTYANIHSLRIIARFTIFALTNNLNFIHNYFLP